MQEECKCKKVFQRIWLIFTKIKIIFLSFILIFIPLELVFYLQEESHSTYKQSPIRIVLVTYKSKSHFTLLIPIFQRIQRVFQRAFHASIWRNFFRTRAVHVSLIECTQDEILWLLNPGGRPLVSQCIKFVFKEGGPISRTMVVTPQPINFLVIHYVLCLSALGQSFIFIPLKTTILKQISNGSFLSSHPF